MESIQLSTMRDDPQNQDITAAAACYIAFLCILFGANAVAIKISLNEMGPFAVAGIRFALAALAISVWAAATGRSFRLKNGQWGPLTVLSVIFPLQLALFYLGIDKTNASRASLIVNLLPFWVLFLSHLFIPGDSLNRRKFIGILLGFIGVIILLIEKKGVGAAFQIGDLVVLAATLLWAGNVVYTKIVIASFQPFHLVLYPMIFSVPIFMAASMQFDPAWVLRISGQGILAMIYQSLITAAFGFVAWNNLMQKYGATALHSFVFIMPISGVFLANLILGEPLTAHLLAAAVCISTGILIVHFKAGRITDFFLAGRGP
jgi:drug/metabolite transporter (DMT)-like permease